MSMKLVGCLTHVKMKFGYCKPDYVTSMVKASFASLGHNYVLSGLLKFGRLLILPMNNEKDRVMKR